MVQNLRAYFILYVITIKCLKCMQEKIEFLVCTKTKVDLNQNLRRSLLGYNDKEVKKLQENSRGWQKDGVLLPRGGSCHPMPPQGYGPATSKTLN